MPYPAEQLGAGGPPKDRELELPWQSTTPVHLPSTATSTTTPGSARSSGRFRAQRAVASHGALSRITSTPVRSETARVELNSKWGSCRRDSTGPRSTSTATFRSAGSRTSAWRRRRPIFESFPARQSCRARQQTYCTSGAAASMPIKCGGGCPGCTSPIGASSSNSLPRLARSPSWRHATTVTASCSMCSETQRCGSSATSTPTR